MNVSLKMSYATGSTMWATLEVQLPADIDVRGAFREISQLVKTAVSTRVDSWHRQHYTVELGIVVVCPRDSDEADADLIANAVCDALGIIPRADMLWNGKSPWENRQ